MIRFTDRQSIIWRSLSTDRLSEICGNPQWARRRGKIHTAFKGPECARIGNGKSLDYAHSSDALLISIFCHPDAVTSCWVRATLGIESEAAKPDLGFKPRTPLDTDKRDNTEIDMKLDQFLVEAKLAESDFQAARFNLISRYRDLEAVFDLADLRLRNGKHCSYQLIREHW